MTANWALFLLLLGLMFYSALGLAIIARFLRHMRNWAQTVALEIPDRGQTGKAKSRFQCQMGGL